MLMQDQMNLHHNDSDGRGQRLVCVVVMLAAAEQDYDAPCSVFESPFYGITSFS